LPDLLERPLRWALVLWLVGYLPLALHTAYGGSWLKTILKVVGLTVLYVVGFVAIGLTFTMFMAVATF
jgi:hypothetical protein